MRTPTQAETPTASGGPPPAPLSRDDSITELLTATRRKIIPIRRAFVQIGHGPTTEPGPLAKFVAHHDERALDTYVLVHALASAAAPHTAILHAGAWARLLGLGDGATAASAKSAVSKVMRRLEERGLVERGRRNRTAVVTLLREDGKGEAFERPQGHTRDDRWMQLPHAYWTEGTYRKLQLPGKALLLIALSLPDGFSLPERNASTWYGMSPSTIGAGLRELEQAEILQRDQKWVKAPRTENGWTQDHRYTLLGSYSTDARIKASRSRYGDPESDNDPQITDDVNAVLDTLEAEESP